MRFSRKTFFQNKNSSKPYQPLEIEEKWRLVWEKVGLHKTDLLGAKRPFYNLMMYPYPSAEGLHVGNVYAFVGADIFGRYQRMQGKDVFEPMGFDSGGIHSENYAIKVGVHPKIQIPKNIKNFRRQLHKIGCMYDWDRTVNAMDPNYYRWTQWLFTQLFKAGLAYKKKALVTFCPSCKTTLADEQTEKRKLKDPVLSEFPTPGVREETVCERCKTPIIKKELEQWFLRITAYTEKLLANTYKLDWSEKVLVAQRNWIGKSEGAEIEFKVQGLNLKLKVFTTRPDTLYGCTFICLAPEFPQLSQLITTQQKTSVENYLKLAKVKSEIERRAEDKEKSGVFVGTYALHPLTAEKLPIYVADYVLMDYGSGVVMGVPAHDQRDWDFAQKYNLPIKPVVKPVSSLVKNNCYEGEGVLVNSGDWNGWHYPQDLKKILNWLEKKGIGQKAVQYKLRDWCVSRQRYWGPPIPMIFCPHCAAAGKTWYQTAEGKKYLQQKKLKIKTKNLLQNSNQNAGWYPIPEDQLPLLLPDTDDYLPGEAEGKPPLARLPEFVRVACPVCGRPAQRETDVSDTFLDSAWYFLAYPNVGSPEYKGEKTLDGRLTPFNKFLTKKWLPVNQYTGGAEHSVLHLLYSRFITMALHDMGYLDFEEPFPHFYAHGLIIKDGAKMSKSRGNIVNPDEYLAKYGTDAVRMYLMFLGPFSEGGDFRDTGMIGMAKFLGRVWSFCQKNFQKNLTSDFQTNQEAYWLNKTIKKVGEDIKHFKYNTAIAAIMELVNFLSTQEQVSLKALRLLILILAPFAPHLTEELWQQLDNSESKNKEKKEKKFVSVHQQPWPVYNPRLIKEEVITMVVQVDGKVREKLKVSSQKAKDKEEIIALASKSPKIQKLLADHSVERLVFVPEKLINIVLQKPKK